MDGTRWHIYTKSHGLWWLLKKRIKLCLNNPKISWRDAKVDATDALLEMSSCSDCLSVPEATEESQSHVRVSCLIHLAWARSYEDGKWAMRTRRLRSAWTRAAAFCNFQHVLLFLKLVHCMIEVAAFRTTWGAISHLWRIRPSHFEPSTLSIEVAPPSERPWHPATFPPIQRKVEIR